MAISMRHGAAQRLPHARDRIAVAALIAARRLHSGLQQQYRCNYPDKSDLAAADLAIARATTLRTSYRGLVEPVRRQRATTYRRPVCRGASAALHHCRVDLGDFDAFESSTAHDRIGVAAGAQHGAATLLFLAHDCHSSEGHPSAVEGRPNSQAAGSSKVSAPGGNLLCWLGGLAQYQLWHWRSVRRSRYDGEKA